MKKLVFVFGVTLLFSSCAKDMNRFIISDLGYEPDEVQDSYIYTLPKTSFKIAVRYEKSTHVPGPYADYALKLLGIENVPKEWSVNYSISNCNINPFTEADAQRYFSVNVLEGDLSKDRLRWLSDKGLVLLGDYYSRNRMKYPLNEGGIDEMLFTDLSTEKNIELRKQTIYKTIITDTSFVEVPVTTEQLARKTIEKKAEEAANLILEIRTDRHYLAAGMLDPYPNSFDLKTALESLDQLEKEYLSLFIGKTFSESSVIEYDVTPTGSLDEENFELDLFSDTHGPGQMDGERISLLVRPSGSTRSTRNLLPQEAEDLAYNRLYYRIPEQTEVFIMKGEKILYKERVSVFQSGALVYEIVK